MKKEPTLTRSQSKRLETWNSKANKALLLKSLELSLVSKGFELIGEGCSRRVFSKKKLPFVLKLPSTGWNSDNNIYEYKTFKRGLLPVAKCSLVFPGGVPVLKMEKVKPLSTPQEYKTKGQIARAAKVKISDLEWIWKVDSYQVGLTAEGKLVAFDVGDHCVSR